jgi:hypothetical protein
MVYFLALIPATALTVAGYVALFLSARSEGALRAFGRYLGFWAFTLAGLVILGAIFAAAHGHRGHGFGMNGMRPMHGMRGMHGPVTCPWSEESRPARPGGAPSSPSPPAPAGPAGAANPAAPVQH